MSKPDRNSQPEEKLSSKRIFFVTTKMQGGRALFQSERNASLLIDVMRALVAERKIDLHDFVVMPDHVHLLMTIRAEMAVEKAMQLLKGRFSYRLKKEFGYLGEVWQRGFSEARVDSIQDFERCRVYIADNPVRAGLVDSPEKFPYCFMYLSAKKAAGAKALHNE
jgi:putative transposase